MRHSLALLLALVLTGCGLLPGESDETRGWSAAKLYAEARDELNNRNYEKAIQLYQKLESRYPYGRFAQQAQIELAYAHLKDQEPALAVAAADRFIKLHPNHPNVDYLYFIKGLANFNDDLGIMAYVSGEDLTERDPKMAREAFDAFKELSVRFPNSKYTPDAVARMNYLVNALASNEVHVARYYLKRGAYVASVNRAQYALTTYPQAPANEDALRVLAEAYAALGLEDLRKDTLRILAKNFPESRNRTEKADTKWWQIWNRW